MKKCLFLIIALAMSGLLMAQDFLNVITFNIRNSNAKDSLNSWPYRKDIVATQILFHEAHLVGVQEALLDQMTDLQERLTRYKYIGVGRSDGKTGSEFSAIFYDTTRLQLLETQTFWLSEQPTVPGSKSWDAAITRIVTWGKFRDRQTKKIFYHFNTHFDHIGQVARRESAKILIQQVNAIAGKTTSIITGDFNAAPTDEPIRVVTDASNPLRLVDSKSISATPHYGPLGTFNGWTTKEVNDNPIDYIFLKNGGKVFQHATLSQTWAGRFSSDHFPVFARIKL
jgi:endonuclease/exonuclease/phosphatase family metal-dependent hydrolase